MIKTFMVKESGDAWIERTASWGKCTKNPWGEQHRAEVVTFEGPEVEADAIYKDQSKTWLPLHAICNHCGEDGGILKPDSTGMGSVWIREDTGERHHHAREFGAGAMYYANWMRYTDAEGKERWSWEWDNQTGPPLIVITPGGEWDIDSRASNCTMPKDRLHRCWIRHGEPPHVHVDKNGHTCAAGAGSILAGSYHGFLHDGYLT